MNEQPLETNEKPTTMTRGVFFYGLRAWIFVNVWGVLIILAGITGPSSSDLKLIMMVPLILVITNTFVIYSCYRKLYSKDSRRS